MIVMMINHTSTHGHQDYSPKKIMMSILKQETPYQVPAMAFLPALPQQAQSHKPTSGQIHPQTVATDLSAASHATIELEEAKVRNPDGGGGTQPLSRGCFQPNVEQLVKLDVIPGIDDPLAALQKSSTLNQGVINLEN